jgi:hypothetical protein
MMEIKILFDDEKLKRGFVDIEKANRIATARTLNTIAGLSRKNAIRNIKADFVLRNEFVIGTGPTGKGGSIVFDQAKIKNEIKDQRSVIGLLDRADFMKLQEEGGIKRPRRGNNLAIAQNAARGGSKRSLVSKNLYLSKIKNESLKWPQRGGSKKARLVAMAYIAQKTKKYFRYKNNIYQVTTFNKSKNRISFQKKHLYNMTQKNARIKSNPWMYPAIQKPVQDAQNIYNSQIRKLLRQKQII